MEQWEAVAETRIKNGMIHQRQDWTERLPVPGGWLYRMTAYVDSEGLLTATNTVFVPDPDAVGLATMVGAR